MVTALYRRYRPETFAELIGQSQVTDPLRTALRTDRVNHAYLFSGPRGCGKTTSARILARCLNCAEGPTDTPCGVCPSCVELSRDGSGSLDVVEIDAASHNGVDDARDLRERAAFAPARDRFKIFILDEAHMVTPQGFNALLKIVEEPPEHVKFIFATTEPDKVIGTIRSRTHHYPFRLVPPAQMLDYVQQLSSTEGVEVEAGVLPLVVRAGGGSVRDTLSLLDQLIAGSEGDRVDYERAVALLGYTHAALLDEVVEAIGDRDAPALFAAIDRVIQTGQDPRRFVDDLLERLRDLIVVAATGEGAAAVLRGIPADEVERMRVQATAFGTAGLSRAADLVNAALSEMSGATSPRLHLELLAARLLVPAMDDAERGALARVERLERRIGIDGAGPESTVAPARTPAAAPAPVSTARPGAAPAASAPATPAERVATPEGSPATAETPGPSASAEPKTPEKRPTESPAAPATAAPVGPVTFQQIKDAWPEILEAVKKAKRNSWLVVFAATPRAYADEVLTLSFRSDNDVNDFRPKQKPGDNVSDHLRVAIEQVLGVRVKFLPRVEATAPAAAQRSVSPENSPAAPGNAGDAARTAPKSPEKRPARQAAAPSAEPGPEPDDVPDPEAEPPRPDDADGWNVVSIPGAAPAAASGLSSRASGVSKPDAAKPDPANAGPAAPDAPEAAEPAKPADAPTHPSARAAAPRERYGEAVVRELLGANFIGEHSLASAPAPASAEGASPSEAPGATPADPAGS
ncbi:MAG: DNA polymerase III subunit gamma/tau [Leifsonia sp.]|nr:DNA polymerase III subunit gamma/tau [Leifsonia sp.]